MQTGGVGNWTIDLPISVWPAPLLSPIETLRNNLPKTCLLRSVEPAGLSEHWCNMFCCRGANKSMKRENKSSASLQKNKPGRKSVEQPRIMSVTDDEPKRDCSLAKNVNRENIQVREKKYTWQAVTFTNKPSHLPCFFPFLPQDHLLVSSALSHSANSLTPAMTRTPGFPNTRFTAPPFWSFFGHVESWTLSHPDRNVFKKLKQFLSPMHSYAQLLEI